MARKVANMKAFCFSKEKKKHVAFLYISNTEPGPAHKDSLGFIAFFHSLHSTQSTDASFVRFTGVGGDETRANPKPSRRRHGRRAPRRPPPPPCRLAAGGPPPAVLVPWTLRQGMSHPPRRLLASRFAVITRPKPLPPLKISCSQGGGAASTLHAATRGAPAPPSIQAPSVVRRYCSAGVSSDSTSSPFHLP